jgi:hypothetical protein
MSTAEIYLYQAEALRKAAAEMAHSDPKAAADILEMATDLVVKAAKLRQV